MIKPKNNNSTELIAVIDPRNKDARFKKQLAERFGCKPIILLQGDLFSRSPFVKHHLLIEEYKSFEHVADLKKEVPDLINLINNQNLNEFIKKVVNYSFDANKYFNDQEPWKKKGDKKRLNTIVYTSLELIRKVTILLYPIIPNTAQKTMKIFNIEFEKNNLETIKNNKFINSGKINKIPILFKKIENND